MKLQGIFVDTTTPFDHAGALYRVKIEHNIAKWNLTSVAGYVVGGSAGEGDLLSSAEKLELWKLAAAAAPDRTLIAGVSAPGVHEAAAQVNAAAEAGFHAALLETPRYPEVTQLYFSSVADRAAIPILIANRFGEAATIPHPNIAGVINYCAGISKSGEFPILCGHASSLWADLQAGAAGAVLAIANAAPYAAIALWEAYRSREEEAGLDWQSRIAPAAELLSAQSGAGALKHAMDLNGYYGGPPRLPWTVPGPEERRQVAETFANL